MHRTLLSSSQPIESLIVEFDDPLMIEQGALVGNTPIVGKHTDSFVLDLLDHLHSQRRSCEAQLHTCWRSSCLTDAEELSLSLKE